MRQASTTITTSGDIGVNIDSFRRHLAAENLSPRTVTSYLEATGQFAEFLAEQGMPQDLANIKREHVESFIAHLLGRWKASTANNRYRGLQSFFTWADEEGELTNGNPMAKMKPPRVPEEPPDVLTDDALRSLIAVCEKDGSFEGRRDAAMIRVFADTGARLSEVANLRLTLHDRCVERRANSGSCERQFADLNCHQLAIVPGPQHFQVGAPVDQLVIGNKILGQ